MLKVDGKDIMNTLAINPGQKIGQILDALLEYVLFDPKRNKKEVLRQEIQKLGKLSDKELKALSQKARKEREGIVQKEDRMTKKKYWVT